MKNHKISRMKYIKYWYTHGGVMLFNYDQFRSLLTGSNINDKEMYYHYLVNPGPDVIILDEAHRIKNSSSVLSALVNKIRTRSRICLTGYPLQNRLLEYYYMIDFIAPGLLGSKEKFDCYFSDYIDKCYSDSSITTKEQACFKLYVLQFLTAFVTHRRGEDILVKDLPPKTEYVVRFKLSPIQHKGYTSLLKLNCTANPMITLLILRSICNHPKIFQNFLAKRLEKKRKAELNKLNAEEEADQYMIESMDIDEDVSDEKSFEMMNDTLDTELVEVNEEAAFSKLVSSEYEWTREYLDNADIESWKCSGKISFIADLTKECKLIGEKIVIVSHSLACLDYIQHLLPIFGIKTGRLDGSMDVGERKGVIDKFHTDESINVMLLSARASAIGINIVVANRIVLIDQDWNPLFDEQSIGRIYRYGQTKPVTVYRLITAATIEERIYKQSVHKKSISERVIDNKPSAAISKEELVRYFREPDSDLSLIDLETQQSRSDMDWISNRVLEQNANTITEFRQYKDDNDAEDMDETFLTESLKLRAKQDAINIISDWKNESRFNL
ncbi:P-loop containing nucleoside triphosphate hydrolase protein [Thamnidium elegans]|nr:P-loop containing nucleoside triphosphate hydrolase protein [Thamnidium elegans]